MSKAWRFLQWGSRLVLGGVLLYAGLTKVSDPRDFARIIANYHLVPESITPTVAWLLPWIEIVTGLSVITGRFYRGGLVWMEILFAIFLVALVWAYAHGLDIECGCFGRVGSSSIGWPHILLDAGALGIGFGLLWQQWRKDHEKP